MVTTIQYKVNQVRSDASGSKILSNETESVKEAVTTENVNTAL